MHSLYSYAANNSPKANSLIYCDSICMFRCGPLYLVCCCVCDADDFHFDNRCSSTFCLLTDDLVMFILCIDDVVVRPFINDRLKLSSHSERSIFIIIVCLGYCVVRSH